jgi:hypothetical protein
LNDVYAKNQAAHDPEQGATDRLARVHGAGELHAALLALLLPRGSRRAARAWAIETADTPGRAGLREHAASLSGAARLPWFERLLARMALQPIAARQSVLRRCGASWARAAWSGRSTGCTGWRCVVAWARCRR